LFLPNRQISEQRNITAIDSDKQTSNYSSNTTGASVMLVASDACLLLSLLGV